MVNANVVTDAQLIAGYVGGNGEAIGALLERHQKRVREYVRMMVRNSDVADDIFQETLIKVVSVLAEGKYVDEGKFLSWVLRIAHNQVIDYFRQNAGQKQVNEADAGFDILNTRQFSDASIEDTMIGEQISESLRQMIDALPEEQGEVIKLRYFSDMSFRDIAEATGVSINTALGRARYALLNLRKLAREHDIVLSAS